MPNIKNKEKNKNCCTSNSVVTNKRTFYKKGSLMEWYKNKIKSRKKSSHISVNNSNEIVHSTSVNKEIKNKKNVDDNIIFKLNYNQKKNLIKCEKNKKFRECVKNFNRNNFLFIFKGKVIETSKTIKELKINSGDVIDVGGIW